MCINKLTTQWPEILSGNKNTFNVNSTTKKTVTLLTIKWNKW